jgi:putative flavoprotein involved in K+ transport
VAAGAFQKPKLPALAAELDGRVTQLTVGTYHRPADIPEGTVLVVGDGASGRDIAADLAGSRHVLLASGRKRRLLPERLLGRSIWWWLNATGLMHAGPTSSIGRFMRESDPFPNRNRDVVDLQRLGIVAKPRALSAAGSEVTFADRTTAAIDGVVWTVGYEDDARWIDVAEAKDGGGGILCDQGRSPVPGLYHLGRPWQRNRASALIMGAGPDAKLVVDHLLVRGAA